MYFLLYNPWKVPWSITVPLTSPDVPVGECEVGCRVVPASDVFRTLRQRKTAYTPSYDDLAKLSQTFASAEHLAGWRLEHFVVELVLGCQQGIVVDGREEDLVRPMFYQRAGPIAAAISVTIDAPENADLGF